MLNAKKKNICMSAESVMRRSDGVGIPDSADYRMSILNETGVCHTCIDIGRAIATASGGRSVFCKYLRADE